MTWAIQFTGAKMMVRQQCELSTFILMNRSGSIPWS